MDLCYSQCEADLPDTLRFGRVEVSCEGWSGPGDPYVLKGMDGLSFSQISSYRSFCVSGSCSLEYRLVQIPDSLYSDSPIFRPKGKFFIFITWAEFKPFPPKITIGPASFFG